MDYPYGQKRSANFSPTTPSHPMPSLAQDNNGPRILRHHRHRRRNIAASVWGIETPPPPSTPASSSTPDSTLPAAYRSFSGPRAAFNIYKSLLRHPNLFFQFCIRLPYASIVSLYAIDKEFHYRLNKYSVGLIHEYALYHAPVASKIFAWILHPDLCISDPMLRPMDGRAWLARDVPGFRWVGMVLHRQEVVRGILTCLAVEGHRVPHLAFAVLCKFWGLMECKTTKLREAFLQDVGIWSSEEILIFQLFMVKLDMRFSDPILGNGIGELSHMLLTQNGLDMLYKVLTGEMRLDYDKVTDILVRTYVSEDFDLDTHPWLDDEIDNGVPEEFWGLLLREGWSVDGKRMESAVDMVITEGIRRGLDVQKYYLDFVLYGFVDEEGNNLPVPRKLCHGSAGKSVEMRWPSEQKRQAVLVSLRELAAAQNTAGPDEMEIDF
ncbi:hypothetical protein E8E12_002381 [Didymella heteroderae]|uniref:Uncharacterized protein n=1 Tax=Didymella heteroderae TaxID=1769908 RepID=A0A9P4WHG6_9PLEO|nr:hypothetical protein E8E12_002381 [Didymella heteroderae]